MTLHATDLALVLLLVLVTFALCYALLVRKLRNVISERQLMIADQMAALDAAIQALEIRLAEHRTVASAKEKQISGETFGQEETGEQGESVTGEIKAVVAAAATAVLGKNQAIKSIRSVPTPWSQQGRVLVQGSHNLRVRQ